jgi:AraC-like DNA-binding protein
LQTESERITAAKAVAAAMQSAVRSIGQVFCGLPAQGCYVIAGIGKYTDKAGSELSELLHVYLLYSADAFTTTVPDSFRITAQQYALDGIKPEKILAAVTDEMKQVHPPAFTSDDLQLLRLRIRLYHDFEEQPSAEDCCRILCFSEGYFRTRYKILFGVSYHQDCIHARISYAKFLLLTTQLSVSAIAAQCGYKEDNYFLRQFRRETGLTPNQFRKILPANARGES